MTTRITITDKTIQGYFSKTKDLMNKLKERINDPRYTYDPKQIFQPLLDLNEQICEVLDHIYVDR